MPRHVTFVLNRYLTTGKEAWETGSGDLLQSVRDYFSLQEILFTSQELAKYDGRKKDALHVAILGRVYDVSAYKESFGKGKFFAPLTGQCSSDSSLH